MKSLLVPTALLACAGALLSGCATTRSQTAAKVKDADERMVAGCTFVGDVMGTSVLGGLSSSRGVENARTEAAEKAAKAGATHIVWGSVQGSMDGASANGRAYRCPEAAK